LWGLERQGSSSLRAVPDRRVPELVQSLQDAQPKVRYGQVLWTEAGQVVFKVGRKVSTTFRRFACTDTL